MIKLAIVALVIVAVVAAIVIVVGLVLPVAHTASAKATVAASPERVFGMLADVERFPQWRSRITRVDVLSRQPLRWSEDGRDGKITFERVEADAGRHLVTRIADSGLPFGGTWTYELQPDGDRTIVTITERGEVYNPLFRFISRFVFGHTATMDGLLADLSKQFN